MLLVLGGETDPAPTLSERLKVLPFNLAEKALNVCVHYDIHATRLLPFLYPTSFSLSLTSVTLSDLDSHPPSPAVTHISSGFEI